MYGNDDGLNRHTSKDVPRKIRLALETARKGACGILENEFLGFKKFCRNLTSSTQCGICGLSR